MRKLEGRTAIIIGAAGGIGRASALLFAGQGARIVAVDRAADVEDTVAKLRHAGGQGEALVGDVADPALIDAAVVIACETFNGLDVVFANAGVAGGLAGLFDLTTEDWTEALRINLVGTFLAVQAGVRMMVAQKKGSIICTAGIAGLRASPMPYSASKAGVISIVQTAAHQLAGTGIRVNAICPGPTEAEDVAKVALFLASDDSSTINGQAIAVDGGLSSSHPIGVGA